MNRETVKNIVSFFINSHKFIHKPRRFRYAELESLIGFQFSENDFNKMLASAFSLAEHYFLLEKYKHPMIVLKDMNDLAVKIAENLNPTQKLAFLTVFLKLVQLNKQKTNVNLHRAYMCTAEIFSFDQKESEQIWNFFFATEIEKKDFNDSILLTSEYPDYCQVVDGLKVLYNPHFGCTIWIKNIKTVNNMLYKVLEFDNRNFSFGIKKNDVLPFIKPVQNLLKEHRVSINELAAKIITQEAVLPRVEIMPTERTPKVILNAAQSRIEIEGVSMSLQPQNFFKPVFYWIEKMKATRTAELSLHINLTFFNTYTAKILLDLFRKALELEENGVKVKIYWYYEISDEDMKEAGENYEAILSKKFIYVSTMSNELISA